MLLRELLEASFEDKSRYAIRGVAIRQLIGLVGAEDADWVLALYFGVPNSLLKRELVSLVVVLPPDAARVRLVAELKSEHPSNRHAAARAIGNMSYPDRRQLLWPLREDDNLTVRKTARHLTNES
jgi:HEAT repeat protein